MKIAFMIYLATVGISLGIEKLVETAKDNKVIREGYTIKKDKISLSEKIIYFIKCRLIYFIPVINLIECALWVKDFDKDYKIQKEASIKDGIIYKREETIPEIEEQIINLIKEYEINPAEIKEKLKEAGYIETFAEKYIEQETSIPALKRKTYSEMSTREKISFLREEEQVLLELQEKEKQGYSRTLGMH